MDRFATDSLREQVRQCVHDLRNVLASQTAAIHLLSRGFSAVEVADELFKQSKQFQKLLDELAAAPDDTLRDLPHVERESSTGVGASADSQGVAKRILVVDDNVDAAVSLARMLQFEGYEVTTAHDGHQAVQQAHSVRPDIVVLDIEMPIMDGYEAARLLREECELPSCKLIAVSGYSDSAHRERALAAGFHAHLTKPVDPEALIRLF